MTPPSGSEQRFGLASVNSFGGLHLTVNTRNKPPRALPEVLEKLNESSAKTLDRWVVVEYNPENGWRRYVAPKWEAM